MIKELNKTPTYYFPLKNLREPADIRVAARQNSWGKYVYAIQAGNTILKYGMSKNEGDKGDRIYRQAAHVRGWNKRFRSGAGADILPTIIEFEDELDRFVTRNDITIIVWDLGDVDDNTVKRIEAELIESYCKENNGNKPIGNHQAHKRALGLRIVNKQLFDSIFDMVD